MLNIALSWNFPKYVPFQMKLNGDVIFQFWWRCQKWIFDLWNTSYQTLSSGNEHYRRLFQLHTTLLACFILLLNPEIQRSVYAISCLKYAKRKAARNFKKVQSFVNLSKFLWTGYCLWNQRIWSNCSIMYIISPLSASVALI